MKIFRFQWQGKVNWGILQEEDEIFALGGDPYGDIRRGEKLCHLQDVKLLGARRTKHFGGLWHELLSPF